MVHSIWRKIKYLEDQYSDFLKAEKKYLNFLCLLMELAWRIE